MKNILFFLLTILFITGCGSKVPIVELKDFIGKYSGEGGFTITIDTIAASDYIKYKDGPNDGILHSFLRDGSYERNGIVYIDDPNNILTQYNMYGNELKLPKGQPGFGLIYRKSNDKNVGGLHQVEGLFYITLDLLSYNTQAQSSNYKLEFRYKNWNQKRYVHVFNKQKKKYEDIELIKSN